LAEVLSKGTPGNTPTEPSQKSGLTSRSNKSNIQYYTL
jgi:hypothetical protein